MPTPSELLSLIRERRQSASRVGTYRELHRLADQSMPKLRAAFLRAAARSNGATRIAELEAAIQRGDLAGAEQAIPWDDVGVRMLTTTMPEELTNLVLEAGIAAERLQPSGLNLRFDVRNPLAIRAAAMQAGEMVTRVSAETKHAIRNVITRAVDEGWPPASSTRRIRDVIGLTERQEGALAKIRETESEQRVGVEARRMLRERATTIASHETMTAANNGQRALWEQGQASHLIDTTARRELLVTPDDRLCPVCRPLNGRTYGMNEPIVTELGSVPGTPLHILCRCVEILVVQ